MRWTIHDVLVIAEKRMFGQCLEATLRGSGCRATVVESYAGRISRAIDLVIATNTSIPPARLQSIIPEIKVQHRHSPILVLSGYCPQDFIADLREKGVDGFLPLPYQENELLTEIARLLSKPMP